MELTLCQSRGASARSSGCSSAPRKWRNCPSSLSAARRGSCSRRRSPPSTSCCDCLDGSCAAAQDPVRVLLLFCWIARTNRNLLHTYTLKYEVKNWWKEFYLFNLTLAGKVTKIVHFSFAKNGWAKESLKARSEASCQNISNLNFWHEASLRAFCFASLSQVDN